MSLLSHRYLACLMAIVTASFGISHVAAGQEDPVVIVIARWVATETGDVLVLPFSDALTEKQKSMITGGFTTVSQLSVRMPGYNTGDHPAGEVFNSQCSVKFDAWEETYDIVRVHSEDSKPFVSKSFSDYATACLTGDITDQDIIKKLAPVGGILQAQLTVKQTSAEEALRIKDWLIQQQSGVMQSLFSHMLGDISLHQTHVVNIRVPERPEISEPATKKERKNRTPTKGKG